MGRRGRRTDGSVRVLARGDAKVLLDLPDNSVGVEELVVDRGPAAELVDLEQALRLRVALGVDQSRVDGAVALLGENLLRRVALRVVDELLGPALRVLGDRDR